MKLLPTPKPNVETLRVDKNIAKNIDFFGGLLEENAHIVLQVMYYICETYQHNIFAFGVLDPADFAVKYALSAENLKRRAKYPIQLENKTVEQIRQLYQLQEMYPEDNRVYDSVLENALYTMLTRTITLSRGGKKVVRNRDDKSSFSYIKTDSLRVLKSLKTVFIRTRRGQEKILYHYVLDSDIEENLTEYYLKGNKENLISLRGTNCDRLYLFLINLRDSLHAHNKMETTPQDTPSFSELCKIAGIEIFYKKGVKAGNEREPKYLKRDLKTKLDELLNKNQDKNFLFSYKFVHRPNHRWAYTCVFRFEQKYPTDVMEKQIRIDERKDIFASNLLHELLSIYKKICPKEYYENEINQERLEYVFFTWLSNGENTTEKELAFKNAKFKTNHSLAHCYDGVVACFIRSIRHCRSMEEFKKFNTI